MDPKENLMIPNIEDRGVILCDFFDSVSISINYKNLNGVFVECNQAFIDLVGKKKEEIIGKKVRDVWARPTADTLEDLDLKTLKNGADKNDLRIEYENLFGRKGTAIFSNRIFKDRSGNKIGIVVSINDITDQKHAEIEAKKSEVFLSSIIDNIPDMVFVKDAEDLRFVRFNKAGEELLGYSRQDLISKNDYDLFPKKEADSFVEKDRLVLREKKLINISEEMIRTKNKGERVLRTQKIPILNDEGDPIYLLGISEDITDKKRYEEEFKANEEKFRKVSEALFNPLVIMDDRGLITYWNKAAEKMFGYKAEEILGENLHKLMAPKKYNTENSLNLKNFFKSGQSPILNNIIEVDVLDKQGNEIPVELSASGLVLGNKIFAIGSMRDMREKKKADREIKEKISELERFNKLMVNRELKMIELKKELEKYKGTSSNNRKE